MVRTSTLVVGSPKGHVEHWPSACKQYVLNALIGNGSDGLGDYMKAAFCIGLLFLASMISSCGGGSGSQTQSQSPSVSALLISPGSASVKAGSAQRFFATAELSAGWS